MNTIHWKNDLITNFDAAGGWIGEAGGATGPDAIPFNVGVRLEAAASTADVAETKAPVLNTLFSFTGADGQYPFGSLIADAKGDLFATTAYGGANDDGTVFEIVKTKGGYASAPTTLVSFAGADGANPEGSGSLFTDASGDLFGSTTGGGANNDGTVFEIAKTKGGYAGAPTTLVSFNGADGSAPEGNVVADRAGNLFGTTYFGGANGDGTVFEIAKTKGGYASAPTTLVSFTAADGEFPASNLITDAAGDLFGTTQAGGPLNGQGQVSQGEVFEIVKTKGSYASAPTVLVGFDASGDEGGYLNGSLILDASGDLFGTTTGVTGVNDGTVFEIAKTKGGYASKPTTLVTFTGPNGAQPYGGLIADADGDLFGTTSAGGTDNDGTVFEIAKTKHGYANATTVTSFTGSNGATPGGGLIANAAGDLMGATLAGGADGEGTVFEITNSGFVPPNGPVEAAAHSIHTSPLNAAFVQAMASFGASRSGDTTPTFLASRHETSTLLSRPQVS